MDERKPLFSAKNITKSFAGTQALKGVDLTVYPGEIVGLVGENGAGKSTLLKIIIGAQPPSSGHMEMHGKPFEPKTPMEANHAGLGMVFQEQSLIVNLNVAQNIFFGHEKEFKHSGFVDWGRMNKAAQQVLEEVDVTDISPRKKVSDLNFATRQMVEIAKVMNVTKQTGSDHCLILLDEPTARLDIGGRESFFQALRDLVRPGRAEAGDEARSGVGASPGAEAPGSGQPIATPPTVLFVTHHVEEVIPIFTHALLLKRGRVVAAGPVDEALTSERVSEAYGLEIQVVRRGGRLWALPVAGGDGRGGSTLASEPGRQVPGPETAW